MDITIDKAAYYVTSFVVIWSAIFFLSVLVLMVRNKNRQPRPPLDRAFIWEKGALFMIVAWYTMRITHIVPGPQPWVVLVLWTNLGLAEAATLWFIYLERYGLWAAPSWIARKRGYVRRLFSRHK